MNYELLIDHRTTRSSGFLEAIMVANIDTPIVISLSEIIAFKGFIIAFRFPVDFS